MYNGYFYSATDLMIQYQRENTNEYKYWPRIRFNCILKNFSDEQTISKSNQFLDLNFSFLTSKSFLKL